MNTGAVNWNDMATNSTMGAIFGPFGRYIEKNNSPVLGVAFREGILLLLMRKTLHMPVYCKQTTL